MVEHTTVAYVQTVLILLLISTNAVLQSIALARLNKYEGDNESVAYARKILIASIAVHYITIVFIIACFIIYRMYSKSFEAHMATLTYTLLIFSSIVLISGGSLGATAALQLQCSRSDENIQSAWKMSTISSVIGIVGTVLMLSIQTFIRRNKLKEAARDYISHKYIKVPVDFELPKPAPQPRPQPQFQAQGQAQVQMPVVPSHQPVFDRNGNSNNLI